MLMPFVTLPDHITRLIAPFTGPLHREMDVIIGAPPRETLEPGNYLPSCFNEAPVMVYPSQYNLVQYPTALRAVATTIGYQVYVDPAYMDTDTAAGLSLLVHERVHVEQFQEIPDFLYWYNVYADVTPHDRPWENPYEMEAYLRECEAYDWFLLHRHPIDSNCFEYGCSGNDGYPPGNWMPLGYTMGFCPN